MLEDESHFKDATRTAKQSKEIPVNISPMEQQPSVSQYFGVFVNGEMLFNAEIIDTQIFGV